MKMNLFAISIISFSLISSAYAEDSSFDINMPSQPAKPFVVTDKMMEKIRTNAIANADELLADPYDVVVGNPIGDITMVQFVDFMCPRSEQMDHFIQALIKANPDLRVVYKPYPLRGNISTDAAKSALIANKQGKYLPYHVALMAVGENLTEDKIYEIAKAQGLDMVQLKKDMQDPQYTTQIADARKLAQKIGVIGTPALFFAITDLRTTAKPNEVVFMLGGFNQQELQKVVDYIKTVNNL